MFAYNIPSNTFWVIRKGFKLTTLTSLILSHDHQLIYYDDIYIVIKKYFKSLYYLYLQTKSSFDTVRNKD